MLSAYGMLSGYILAFVMLSSPVLVVIGILKYIQLDKRDAALRYRHNKRCSGCNSEYHN